MGLARQKLTHGQNNKEVNTSFAQDVKAFYPAVKLY